MLGGKPLYPPGSACRAIEMSSTGGEPLLHLINTPGTATSLPLPAGRKVCYRIGLIQMMQQSKILADIHHSR